MISTAPFLSILKYKWSSEMYLEGQLPLRHPWLHACLITRTFFGEISRILFALFVHRRFCLHCLYFAMAHMMQFCFPAVFFFFGGMPFRRWAYDIVEKEKILIAAKSGLVAIKGYLEIYNRVKYFCDLFWMRPVSRQTFWVIIGP